jgi:hydrogenase-4 component H
MSLLSKIKEAVICWKAGKVTLAYPLAPDAPPERFRGRPIFDADKCVGCAGCANNCPAREILVFDPCQEVRILKYLGRRCTFCGRCADVCPEKAITMSRDFEMGTDRIADLGQELHLFMGTCQRCGRCYREPGYLERLKLKGYRMDDLAQELSVPSAKSFLEGQPAAGDIEIELE